MAEIENPMLEQKFVWIITGGHESMLTWQVGHPYRVPDTIRTWRCSTALVHEEWPTEPFDLYGTSSMEAAVSAISSGYSQICRYIEQGHFLCFANDKADKLTIERLHSSLGIIGRGIEAT
jgi:hypothetical protein